MIFFETPRLTKCLLQGVKERPEQVAGKLF